MGVRCGVLCVFVLLCGHGDGLLSHHTLPLSTYELTVPRQISREKRDLRNALPNKVSYVIHAQGRDHVVILEKNKMLLPDDFTVYSYAKDGSLMTEQPKMQNHCHYQGYVEDVPGSSVAMSICSGLRGVLHVGNYSYGVEPLESSTSSQHMVFQLKDVLEEPHTCGTPHVGDEHGVPLEQKRKPLRTKRAVLHQTHYVELYLVVDNERFVYKNRNQTAVRDEMIQLANYIDSMYVALNIRVVLVGLEIWNQQNPISTDGSAGEVLSRFVQWREQALVSRRRHDSAQLILKKNFGSTAGMAFVGTVCSQSHGGGINALTNTNIQYFASIVAHELGHNLGMNHDDGRGCYCAVDNCIMNASATGSQNFSSCSADDFENLVLNSRARCLLNVPRPEEAYSSPYCGNKLVDVGEECDCGSEKECEQDPCCEPKTCKLKPWAQCSDGACCRNCRYQPAGTVCRSSIDACDLPEYCNGSSALCRSDFYKQNGQPCLDKQAYCYNGRCQHLAGQCKAIFGPEAKAAPEVCFQNVNLKGDRFGNCGYQGQGYKKCESRNAMCGKLQCVLQVWPVTVFGIKPDIIRTSVAESHCWGVDFQLGSDVPDPGMVNEGTRCGENKVCLNYQCVGMEALKYDCNAESKCHGHGVCNNNRNCHCESGWAPPNCLEKGYGGSVDSGPTWNDKDTSTRDGLLVFFFLVLPLVALGCYIFFRRNELQRRFCRRKRSQEYSDTTARRANSQAPPGNSRIPPQRGTQGGIVKNGHQVQLLPPEEVVQTNRSGSTPSYAPPPYHFRPPVGAQQQLLPQRPAPPPPV